MASILINRAYTMIHQDYPRSKPLCNTRHIILFAFVFVLITLFIIRKHLHKSEKDWDLLIFTQSWPNTVCLKWKDESPANHSCRFPKENGTWTVHGLWPTKLGTLGPKFCNSSYHFNMTQLATIQTNLTEYWTDVMIPQPTNSFWKHEWLKHGTCCSSLPQLNTELKYFSSGLQFLKQYDMKEVLERSGVSPDSNSTTDVVSIWLAVKAQLGVNPSIHCLKDKKTHQYYLQEIRICFDKTLQLVDCDGVKSEQGLNWTPDGNCPDGVSIVYPDTVPPVTQELIPSPPESSIMTLHKVVKLVRWLTL